MSQVSSPIKSGFDTWVNQGKPNQRNGTRDYVRLSAASGAVKRGLLWMPVPARAIGRTIASATLTGHCHGTMHAQTITVTPVVKKWDANQVTYGNQPATVGTAITKVLSSSLADGAEVVFDVTSLVQQISNGQDNLGWRLTTNVTTAELFASFQSGLPSWRLDITYVDVPDAPSGMSPNGTVVSAPLPVSTFDYTTFGGDDSDLAKISFQVDKGNNGSVDYDSGFQSAVLPQVDLSTSALTGITAGTQVAYRYKVQDSGGQSSAYSDWAVYTYQPLPTLTLDSPASGVLFDPTSDVLAHISTTHLEAFRIRVTDGDDRTAVRFDSTKTQATDPSNIAYGLPLKNDDGSRIFTDDEDFQIQVVAFDDYEREACPGLGATPPAPDRVILWTTVHFDDDAALGTVTTFTAAQVQNGPKVQLTWTDAAAPDAYLISRGNTQLFRPDPADVVVGAGTYSVIDTSPVPGRTHTYSIRRITDGVGRSDPVNTSITVNVEGTWLLRSNGDMVVLDDPDDSGISGLHSTERRLTYDPLNLPYQVDILTQYEGISGPVSGSVEDDDDRSYADAKAVLDAIKAHSGEVVRLAYIDVNVPVKVSYMDVQPEPPFVDGLNRHLVNFTVKQVGEFDFRVG